jgi:hypothetical protein
MTPTNSECKNCGNSINGKYCSNCGQKANEKRFTIANLPGEFLHGFFHLHGGFFYTLKEISMHPGEMLRGFISGKRVIYFNPFTFVVLLSLLGGFVYNHSGIIEHIKDNPLATGETVNFTHHHFVYRMLLTVPTYAFMCWILFRSSRYNFAEHLIINTFIIGQSIVFLTVWLLILNIVKPGISVFPILYLSGIVTLIIYQIAILSDLFKTENLALRLSKSALAVIGGLGLSYLGINLFFKLLNLL